MGNVNLSLTRQVLRKFLAPVGIALAMLTTSAHAFTLSVVDPSGVAISGFKWVLEEDNTYPVIPGSQTKESLALNFHKSYAPVEASGVESSAVATITPQDSSKNYFVSVLPFVGYQMNGVKINAGEIGNVTVVVNPLPLPTAQISILLFPDTFTVNGVFDFPQEQPADNPDFDPTEFRLKILDPAGQMLTDAFGDPFGELIPDIHGRLTIKNLAPGKYGIVAEHICSANPSDPLCLGNVNKVWQQTSTIEGGPAIDAWVAANEPVTFVEFGPLGQHVFMGFVKPINNITGGTNTLTGRVINQHMSRPPTVGFFPGNAFANCWIALQPGLGATTPALYTQPCNPDSTFQIDNIPDGNYQIVVWDSFLNILIATQNITIPLDPANPSVNDLGDFQVFNWFARLEAFTFADTPDGSFPPNGYWDQATKADEVGIPEETINIRFRDGRIYQTVPAGPGGDSPFDQVFPFFHWLVAEFDFATKKVTGVTYRVDDGGAIDPATNGGFEQMNPQAQGVINPLTGDDLSVSLVTPPGELPTLTLAFQAFLGQTNIMEIGKTNYTPSDVDLNPTGWETGGLIGPEDIDHNGNGIFDTAENGGVSGVVYYGVTRAEDDPAYAAAEEWEPGIPRVPVALYKDFPQFDPITGIAIAGPDGIIDDLNDDGGVTYTDVDFYPFDWTNPPAGTLPVKGTEDIDHNSNGVFDLGDAIDVTSTDSWDDNVPTDCVNHETYVAHPNTNIQKVTDCYDGFRNFNQVREGVFDGGYAFPALFTNSLDAGGQYIVQIIPPNGYELVKEEDKNVDFGEEYTPALLPPACVGLDRVVPNVLSFQTDDLGGLLPGVTVPIAPASAGLMKPLCDLKVVGLSDGQNAAADFFLFTQVPAAAHVSGVSLDDLSNEFDPNSPNFGEKFGLPWMPVVFRDWTGRKITKIYTDEFGRYNAMLPSTFTINVPSPTGVSPNMLTACMNDPDPEVVGTDVVTDLNHKPKYSTTCYTFNYTPAATTYLDTPVVPVAAFAGRDQFPVDCALLNKTPGIKQIDKPFISPSVVGTARYLTIESLGVVTDVPNPDWDGTAAVPQFVQRDYGFGDLQGAGYVTMGGVDLTVISWSDLAIVVDVPTSVSTGTVLVTNDLGVTSQTGVTVTTSLPVGAIVRNVSPDLADPIGGTPIQSAIDLANAGDMIVLAPGSYFELVILDKPVTIQGHGAAVTTINGMKQPSTKVIDWRTRITNSYNVVAPEVPVFDLANGQTAKLPQLNPTDPILFHLEEGPVITVLSTNPDLPGRLDWGTFNTRIDGLTLTGADLGGGVLVNSFAHNLEISNNLIEGNQGSFSGGIKVGDRLFSAVSNNLNIHHNQITQNGAAGGSGGGISLHTGTDFYSVTNNFICGNFTQGNGAGIGHEGLSKDGVIENNAIVFNQSFHQMNFVEGGGIFVGGIANAAGPSDGSGSVRIEGNHIEGNHAGAGFGGGIKLRSVNGTDVALSPAVDTGWYNINIYDNFIVGNVAGNTGGGLSITDAARVNVINNTIAHNDSTATTGQNFVNSGIIGVKTTKEQNGAGIVTEFHSTALTNIALFTETYANPVIENNIIWQNRSFLWKVDTNVVPQVFGLEFPLTGPDATLPPQLGRDLAVLGGSLVVPAVELNPVNNVLTTLNNNSGGTYDPLANNITSDPVFARSFNNGARDTALILVENTTPGSAVAIDEGGNFIDVRYGPLSMIRDYHIAASNSPVIDVGLDTTVLVGADIDGDARPIGALVDIGADEVEAKADTDGDFIFNIYDNCTNHSNTSQVDTDGDNYGNACDADFNNSGLVDFPDYFTFVSLYGTADPEGDFNESGMVDFPDYFTFVSLYGLPPGPSAWAP